MLRSVYTLHAEEDDYGHAGTLVREVWNDAQRAQFVDQVAGSLLGGMRSLVLERAFDYWKHVDARTGRQIEDKVRAGSRRSPSRAPAQRASRPPNAKTRW